MPRHGNAFRLMLTAVTGTIWLVACSSGATPVEPPPVACLPTDCVIPSVLDVVQLLPVATYEGSGQVVHPDVATGTGMLAGYWLAITPYPGGDVNFENPSVFHGADGLGWSLLPGSMNPVEHRSTGSYLSDPDLVFDDNSRQLWMFYREVVDGQNLVKVTRSGDGVRWGTAMTVASAPSHQIVSPTVVRGAPGAAWTMWAVDAGTRGCTAGSSTIERRISGDGLHWSAPVVTDLAQPGAVIWHIDVEWIADRSEYWAVYNTHAAGTTCATDALYLARSADGLHWTTYPSPIVQRGIVVAFTDVIYRSSFRVNPSVGTVTLWLSGATYTQLGYVWRAAMLTRRIDDLLATASLPQASLRAPPRRDLPPPEPDVGPAK